MIKRIKICDFKSIRKLDLALDPVTVLVGRSGTGKSNIVQAIRFLRNLLLNQREAVSHEGGWERILPVGEQRTGTLIEITFSPPGQDRDYEYSLGFGVPHHMRAQSSMDQHILTERLGLGQEVLFSGAMSADKGWVWDKAPAIEPMPTYSGSPFLGRFPSSEKVVSAYAALSSAIGYYHFPATTLLSGPNSLPGMEFLRTIPGLWDNASNFREIMRGITQDFQKPHVRKSIMASLQAVNPSIVSVELDSLINPQRAVVGHDAAGRIFELSLDQESDGLRRFYAHLLALHQSPPKLTLIFEEPENAIFPGALTLLADELKAAPRENRGQVILTTHSPTLLDSFDVDSVRAVEMRDGKTIVGPVSKEQRDAVKEHLLTTGDLLTVDRAKIEDPTAAEQAA